MQRTWVLHPTCHGATQLTCHNYRAHQSPRALEPAHRNERSYMPQGISRVQQLRPDAAKNKTNK